MSLRYPDRINRMILAATSSSNSSRNNALFGDWATCLEKGTDPAIWFRNIFYWIFTARFFENEAALEEALRYALEYPYPQSAAAFGNQVKAVAGFDCTRSLCRIKGRNVGDRRKGRPLVSPRRVRSPCTGNSRGGVPGPGRGGPLHSHGAARPRSPIMSWISCMIAAFDVHYLGRGASAAAVLF